MAENFLNSEERISSFYLVMRNTNIQIQETELQTTNNK